MMDSPNADFFQEEFGKLMQMRQKNTFGVAVLDRDFRYRQVNELMEEFNSVPIDRHLSRSVQEVNPGVWSALGPVLQYAIEEGKPLLNLEAKVPQSATPEAPETRYWNVNCYPVKAASGLVLGTGIVLQDVTEQKLKDALQEERLKFEALLSDLSAAFINVPVSEVDRKIEQGLQKIVEFLEFDRSSVWQFQPTDQGLHLTHSYSLPGVIQPPPVLDEAVPIWTEMVRKGEMFRISDVDELPDSQWREKKYCKDHGGIKSFLFIPLNVGGTISGLMSFASYRVKKTWPDGLIQRLRLVWEIFGNALERKKADQKIQQAIAEIEELKNRLEAENTFLRDQIDIEQKHEEIIGQSAPIRKVLQQVKQVANTNATVLLLGETGTGKELLARAIHNMSGRQSRPMIKLNCAALPATLIEAELFGREKGAYTGALTRQTGRFEAANGSTIFLDEIGEIPLELQSKLLRVLQEGQFERLGSTTPIEVDVRVIAATNRDLAKAVKEGRFREDLYYRLNVFPISVPPLRERQEDIPLLVWAIVKEFSHTFGKTIERIPKKNMEALERFGWPGNIRELRNMIERAMILSNSSTLIVDLPDNPLPVSSQALTLAAMERRHILSVLEKTGRRIRGKNGAAEILGLNPNTLDSKMKKLGIHRTAKNMQETKELP